MEGIEEQLTQLEQQAADFQKEYDSRLEQHSEISAITVFNRDEKLAEAEAVTMASEQQLANLIATLAAMNKQIGNQEDSKPA